MQRSVVHLSQEADAEGLSSLIRQQGGKVERVIPGFAIFAFLPHRVISQVRDCTGVLSVREERGVQLPPMDESVPQ